MNDILIIGAGQLAREMHSWIQDCITRGAQWRIKGFLDWRIDMLAGLNYETPIISSVEDYSPRETDLFVCAKGEPALKKKYCELLKKKHGRFATLVHPTAVIGANVKLGEGVIIAPFALLTADIRVGNHVYIGPTTCVSHDNEIGDYCQLSGNVTLGGRVVLEDSVFVGLSATLLPGVRVGKNSVVGAASLVLKKVGSDKTVFGIPARPI